MGVLAAAQSQYAGQYEGRTIASVVYNPLPQPLDPRDLGKMHVLRAGSAFREADAAVTIDRLFATGYYDDIQIDVTPQGDQVVVRVIAKNAWLPRADKLEIVAAAIHENADSLSGSESIDSLAHGTPDKMQATTDYVLQQDLHETIQTSRPFVRKTPCILCSKQPWWVSNQPHRSDG